MEHEHKYTFVRHETELDKNKKPRLLTASCKHCDKVIDFTKNEYIANPITGIKFQLTK